MGLIPLSCIDHLTLFSMGLPKCSFICHFMTFYSTLTLYPWAYTTSCIDPLTLFSMGLIPLSFEDFPSCGFVISLLCEIHALSGLSTIVFPYHQILNIKSFIMHCNIYSFDNWL